MSADRPKFCQIVKCPLFGKRCNLNDYVGSRWLSPTGRGRERLRLIKQAAQNPQEVIRQCAEKGFGYGEGNTDAV